MKDERNANQAVTSEIDARVDNSAVPLTSNDRAFLLHCLSNIHFTDLREKESTTETLNNIREGLSSRKIRHDGPGLVVQNVSSCHHKRVIFSDRLAFLRHDREPIRIHVL